MIPLLILAVLFLAQAVLFERERIGWRKERAFLTNAAIARSQTEFVLRQKAVEPAPVRRPAPPVVASLSDLPEDVHTGAVTAMPLGL